MAWGRRALRALALVAVLIVGLVVAVAVVSQTAWFRERVRRLAVRHGQRGLVDVLRDAADTSVAAPSPAPALTAREAVVLHALTRTGSAAEIAETLVVSPNTVKSQLRSLYRKLGVTSRPEALDAARRLGLLGAQDALGPQDTPTR